MSPNPPSSGQPKGRFAPFGLPLMSNVRPHVRPQVPAIHEARGCQGEAPVWPSATGRFIALETTRYRSRDEAVDHVPKCAVPASWLAGNRHPVSWTRCAVRVPRFGWAALAQRNRPRQLLGPSLRSAKSHVTFNCGRFEHSSPGRQITSCGTASGFARLLGAPATSCHKGSLGPKHGT